MVDTRAPDYWTWDRLESPRATIQWKGTDVCMDFPCPCGAHNHIDAEFAYYVKCWSCEKTFQMGTYIQVREIEGSDPENCIAMDEESLRQKQLDDAINGVPDAYRLEVSRGRLC